MKFINKLADRIDNIKPNRNVQIFASVISKIILFLILAVVMIFIGAIFGRIFIIILIFLIFVNDDKRFEDINKRLEKLEKKKK